MRIDKKMRRGFTLVELLVVLAIIALLIAILLPVLKRAKESANTVKCMAQQRQIMTATMMYVQENKGRFPLPPSIGDMYSPTSTAWQNSSLMYYMDPARPNGVIRYDAGSLWPYLSPGANRSPTAAVSKTHSAVLEQIMNCPSEPREARVIFLGGIAGYDRNFSYSWNVQMGRVDSPYQPYISRTTRMKGSSHKILLIEEMAPNDGVCWVQFELNDPDDVPSFRHNGRACFGFGDGHVETLEPTQMGWERIKTGSLNQHPRPIDMNKNHYYFALHVDQ